MTMGVATWTLIAVVLGAIVTFSVELRTSIRALRGDIDTTIDRLDTKIDRLDIKIDTVRVDLAAKLDRRFDILSADVAAIRAAQHRTDGQLQVLVAMAHSHPGSQAAVGPAPAA